MIADLFDVKILFFDLIVSSDSYVCCTAANISRNIFCRICLASLSCLNGLTYTTEQINAAMTAPVEMVTGPRTSKVTAINRMATTAAIADAAKERKTRIATQVGPCSQESPKG